VNGHHSKWASSVHSPRRQRGVTPTAPAATRPRRHPCRLRRPTAAAHFWEDHPSILGGRDLAAGGTWLAVSTTPPRAAFLTNFREASPSRRGAAAAAATTATAAACRFAPSALLRAARLTHAHKDIAEGRHTLLC
jgi:hypothetical protein